MQGEDKANINSIKQGAQEPEAELQTELVFLDVFRGNFSPISADVTSKKIPRLLARLFKRGQRVGGSRDGNLAAK